MKQIQKQFLLVATFLVFVIPISGLAIEADKLPANKQSVLKLHFTAVEADKQMKSHGGKTLFIDVRDPAEVHVLGMPAPVDANVPFKFLNTRKWNTKKSQFALDKNPDFVKGVAAQLKAKGLTGDDTIVLICGSGKRAAKAVGPLAKAGYKNVYSISDGYAGWQKSKLDWSKKLDIKKMYGDPVMPKK